MCNNNVRLSSECMNRAHFLAPRYGISTGSFNAQQHSHSDALRLFWELANVTPMFTRERTMQWIQRRAPNKQPTYHTLAQLRDICLRCMIPFNINVCKFIVSNHFRNCVPRIIQCSGSPTWDQVECEDHLGILGRSNIKLHKAPTQQHQHKLRWQ